MHASFDNILASSPILTPYPINQNLFSINFFSHFLGWQNLYIFQWEKAFFLCVLLALLGWQAVVFWFIITISESGRRGFETFPMTSKRERFPVLQQRRPKVWCRKIFSAVTTKFRWLWITLGALLTATRIYWQRLVEGIFHFLAQRGRF